MATNGEQIMGAYNASALIVKNHNYIVSTPQPGDIFFKKRIRSDGTTGGHVGIVESVENGVAITIEGNAGDHSDRVTRAKRKLSEIGYVWARPNFGSNSVDRLLYIARSQLEYIEGSGNYSKYGEWFGRFTNTKGMANQPWCAMFVSWCFHMAYDDDADFSPITDAVDSGVQGWDSSGDYNGGSAYTGPNVFRGRIWGNSSLVTYYSRLSNGSYFNRENRASHITVHSAFASAGIQELASMVNSSSKGYNYGVDVNGVIGLFVDEFMWTNSCDDWDADRFGINIICSTSGSGLSSATESALTDLLEEVYRRNFIYVVTFNDNVDDTLTCHSMYNKSVDCPGAAVKKQLRSIADEVNSRLSAEIHTNFVQVGSRLAESRLNALRTQSLINVKQINPYTLTVDTSIVKPREMDYDVLNTSGVVGVFFNVGSGYNSHNGKVEFETTNTYKLCDGAKSAGMPFGIVFTSKANTMEQLRKEAYWLHFIVSKHPPKLGIWLDCGFGGDSSQARSFVSEWYEYFVDWGLKSKCGLYCNKSQATRIGWPNQSNYLPLWLAGEMNDTVCPDDELLTPTFFKLDDLSNYGIGSASSYISGLVDGLVSAVQSGVQSAVATYEGALKTILGDGWRDIIIPQVTDHSVAKKYESYTAITNKNTINYKLTHSADTTTDELGFRKYDGRYLIAVGSGVCAQTGTYMDVTLANGTVIPCIMADGKANKDTESQNIYTNVNDTWCCSEFIVDTSKLDSKAKKAGDVSKVNGWNSPVTSIKVYDKRVVGL